MVVIGLGSCLFAQEETAGNDKPGSTGITGTWHLSWQGKRAREATLELQQDGSKLTGTFNTEGDSGPVSGKVKGSNVSFKGKGKKKSLSFNGTIDGNKMSGTTQYGTSWNASRQ
jgi:hypothetical protein